MAIIPFDMHRTGRTIAELRRTRNMTQMQLADEMGVSYQAVSNWERGQSMPDVSKLPELAELFGTTIDHLLGRKSPMIEAAAAGDLSSVQVTPDELAAAAPLLTPNQVDQAAVSLAGELDDASTLNALLPFLSEDKVNELSRTMLQQGKNIDSLLPFMREDVIDRIASAKADQRESIDSLLPVSSEEVIDGIALERIKQRRMINDLTPFTSEALLNRLADLLSGRD